MSQELTFQDPGEGIHEGEIVEVHVSEGDEVAEGDTVLTVETDKATDEVPSPFDGRVERVAVEAGDVVSVGDVLVTFVDGAGEEQGRKDEQDEHEQEEEEADEAGDRDGGGGGKAAAVGELPDSEEHEGPREDERRGEEAAEDRSGPVPAAPSTRRLARELDVDLSQVEASGPGGRVLPEDVRAAGGGGPEQEPEEAPRPARPELPDFERWGTVERVDVRGVRRAVAQRMATAWAEIPHVTHHDLADITDLERFRRSRVEDGGEAWQQVTLTVLLMKALAGVLQRHPRFNASFDAEAEQLVIKHYHHVGLAVDTDDGLIVPVVRDVDRKPIGELAAEVAELVGRTKRREVDREEMQGGTITVTNVGPMGGTAFAPIIRFPEVAIVGMAAARLQPIVRGDLDDHETEVRLVLPLSVSYDHRVNDGADAARFTTDLVDALSDPESLLLNV